MTMERPKQFQSFYKDVGGNEGALCHYSTRLDTYGCGCYHNCAYCYARSLLGFRGLWNPQAPAVARLGNIRKIIATKLQPGEVVRLGGMTDCFQPIEKRMGLTREVIKELNARRIHYLIVTKSPLVVQYIPILDKDLAHIQISITSTDSAISRDIEPGAALPPERIHAVEMLQAAGYDVAVRLSPFIPEFVDLDVINAIRCDKIQVEFLRVNGFISRWLEGRADLSLYTYQHGGYNHLPLVKKRIWIRKITGFREVSVCEDVPEHWEYWKHNLNANPEDCCNLRGIYQKVENPV